MFSLEVRITTYYSFVQSHLTYGILLWGNSAEAQSVYIMQKKAIRTIFRLRRSTHCREYFMRYQILTLPCLFILSCLKFVKENIQHFPIHSDVHQYSTRNCKNIVKENVRLTKSQSAFEPVRMKVV